MNATPDSIPHCELQPIDLIAGPFEETQKGLGVSRDNYEFDPDESIWRLNKDISINLDLVLILLALHLRAHYRALMKFYAENNSPAYCSGIHQSVAKLLRDMATDGFSESVLRRYRASLVRSNEWRLGNIRPFLKRWHDQGYEGVSSEAVEYLKSLRIKGNEKGRAVLTLDPDDGPFDDQELAAILDVAPQAYEQGRIDLVTLAVTLLLVCTGRRPGQLTLLRVGDLQQTSTTNGRIIDMVRIPRSKQRGRPPRSDFKNFWLPSDVFRVLSAQRDAVLERVAACLGKLPANLVAELPLFPNWDKLEQLGSIKELDAASRNDALHITTQALSARVAMIEVLSARTGKRLRMIPRRFRYTLGTRAGREGYGFMVIAELLDHSDVQNVQVYIRDHPNFREKLDRAVDRYIAPLARKYAARLVDREEFATHGDDPSMRVGTREQKVGTCGSQGFCGAQAAACYTCMHFQPWLDAPHEKMHEWFLAVRERAVDVGADEHVVAATDRSILGAQVVIAACEARKGELAGEGDQS